MNVQLERQKLITFFRNEPLVIFDEEITGLDISNNETQENNMFLGIGLMTSTEVSVGVPFDILGMLLIAEKIRRKLNFHQVIIQIADEHALTNANIEVQTLNRSAKSLKLLLINICRHFDLPDFNILLSSEVNKQIVKDELKDIASRLNIPELLHNQYFFCELTDMEFFRRFHKVTTKISWIIPGVKGNGHDERFFDDHFSPIWRQHLNFIHIEPGFTFTKSNWRTSPYIHKSGQNRILLRREEQVENKLKLAEAEWKNKSLGGAMNHLKKIIRIFESLFGNLGRFTFEEKLELIIKKAIDGD